MKNKYKVGDVLLDPERKNFAVVLSVVRLSGGGFAAKIKEYNRSIKRIEF
jgi:hypothetical protein